MILEERELLAKYPFLIDPAEVPSEIISLVERALGKDDSPEVAFIRSRALERLRKGLERGRFSRKLDSIPSSLDPLGAELSIYVLCCSLVGKSEDPVMIKRYSNIEAESSRPLLYGESIEDLVRIAKERFDLDVRLEWNPDVRGDYSLWIRLMDYLRAARGISSPDWSLPRRLVRNGYVLLGENIGRIPRSFREKLSRSKRELARLMIELAKSRIEDHCRFFAKVGRLENDLLRKEIGDLVGRALVRNIARTSFRSRRIIPEALPPCILHIVRLMQRGETIPHSARFSIASFLIALGVDEEEIVNLFRNLPDFDERKTRYQLEHISGKRTGKKYSPPSCHTMKSYGLCIRECNVNHPLTYFFNKLRDLQAKGGGSPEGESS